MNNLEEIEYLEACCSMKDEELANMISELQEARRKIEFLSKECSHYINELSIQKQINRNQQGTK